MDSHLRHLAVQSAHGLAGDGHQPGGVGAGERNHVDENSMHRVKGTTGMAGSCFSNYSLLGGFALGGHGIRQGTQGPGDEQVELHYVCHSHL